MTRHGWGREVSCGPNPLRRGFSATSSTFVHDQSSGTRSVANTSVAGVKRFSTSHGFRTRRVSDVQMHVLLTVASLGPEGDAVVLLAAEVLGGTHD